MENACGQPQKRITETTTIKIYKVPNLDLKSELIDRGNNTKKTLTTMQAIFVLRGFKAIHGIKGLINLDNPSISKGKETRQPEPKTS